MIVLCWLLCWGGFSWSEALTGWDTRIMAFVFINQITLVLICSCCAGKSAVRNWNWQSTNYQTLLSASLQLYLYIWTLINRFCAQKSAALRITSCILTVAWAKYGKVSLLTVIALSGKLGFLSKDRWFVRTINGRFCGLLPVYRIRPKWCTQANILAGYKGCSWYFHFTFMTLQFRRCCKY